MNINPTLPTTPSEAGPRPAHGPLDDAELRALLWAFYGAVMQDGLLAPVFRTKLGPFPGAGWPVHIARLAGFWRAVTGSPSHYRGQPALAHRHLGIGAEHFDRWLELWQDTLNGQQRLPSTQAHTLLTLARRMRVNLQRAALHQQDDQ
ncbi:group III truncated hemoglobin [Deinococcus sp. QL22]|uniref:group III truncated hemoglobin n=1 Tax=Deinococcus sp. QL22 TaxID=2939437 RepID=UPI002017ACDB|nr:group III truncated hemoglobin [Deinococcus sp. QL22]UQN09478.1 group III truncated hemoglobin [Deinococcus sp. QL22]